MLFGVQRINLLIVLVQVEDDEYLLPTWGGDDGGGSVENMVKRSVLGDGEL